MNVESPDDLAIEQRYLGLKWVKDTCKPPSCKGVVYFGDDDNKYDLRLFEEVSYYGYISYVTPESTIHCCTVADKTNQVGGCDECGFCWRLVC